MHSMAIQLRWKANVELHLLYLGIPRLLPRRCISMLKSLLVNAE